MDAWVIHFGKGEHGIFVGQPHLAATLDDTKPPPTARHEPCTTMH
jgi:hypothetical protein